MEPLETRSVLRKDPPNESGVFETYAQPQALCPWCLQWSDVDPNQLISWALFVCTTDMCEFAGWADGESKIRAA